MVYGTVLYTLQYDILYDTDTIQRSMVQYVIRYDRVWYGTVWYMERCSTTYSIVQYDMGRYSIEYVVKRYSILNSEWYSTVRYRFNYCITV